MEEQVRLGQLDVLLVKPFSPWAYLTFSGYNIGYISHITLAVGLMAWAIWQVDVAWSIGLVLYLVAAIASAGMMVAAIMTMIGASSIVLVQSRYLFSIFFGFWELSRFPLNIYPAAWDTSAYDFAGAYTLTIEADDACPSAPSPLHPQLRRRTLPAQIEHVGSRLTVRVSGGPTEQPSGFAGCVYGDDGKCVFNGKLSTGGATFWLRPHGPVGWDPLPDLLESIQIDNPPSPLVGLQELWFIGTATTNFSANGFLGNLDGTITYYPIGWPNSGRSHSPTAACRAGRFELSRR
jgi:hypothetical protein